MTRRTGLLLVLTAAGLFLYLWPALRAPVVLWSDSAIDVDWAHRGVGIVSPIPPSGLGEEAPSHPAKPAYLLFLRAAQAIAPGNTRFIVVVQSFLLWASIAATSLFMWRRRSVGIGIGLYLLLLFFLRLRDSASAVMPEALATALFLPIAASLLDPPRGSGAAAGLGLGTAVLFWVRPNVGGVALVLAVLACAQLKNGRAAAALVGGFFLVFAPIWIATRPPRGSPGLRGLAHSMFEASLDYYWVPSSANAPSRSPEAAEGGEIAVARDGWKATLARSGPDSRRQLIWRALHGLLGTEFYDARWSPQYRAATTISRIAAPFLILAASAALFVSLATRVGFLGVTLVLLLVVQDLILGSNPRFVLPFLPALLLLAAVGASSLRTRAGLRVATAVLFGLFVASIATHAYVLDWQWGRIESAGVEIRQRISRGALPEKEPATLHVRIAPPLVPSSAHVEVRGPNNELLYTSARNPEREKAAITVPLPQSVLDANSRRAIELSLTSSGSYGATQYLLFPVIPPPLRSRATREGSDELSPSTGIRSGSLDWWAHRGAP